MSEKEAKKVMQEMIEFSKKVSGSKKSSQKFLFGAGIVDSKGNLKKYFKSK